ncbi:transcription termination factor 4, mitochondrial isoform X2 [Hemicordylus capensis]|uniref:transcription termination factor 4, mitochondrial isoform X2 n=1 Tax=Hemicordylus capensis TaxID=884348 RepID=UPI00230305E2|nr:transcription termination factor 4, mitochondrial isoform X2 [Hemicordylus capensis]
MIIATLKKILQKQSFVSLACHCIQFSPLSASPVSFRCSLLHLGCRSTGTSSSEQSEVNLTPNNSKAESNESTQKLLEILATSPAEQQRPSDMGHLKKVADSFFNMGFSPAQMMQLFTLQPSIAPQSRLAVISELLLLGLSIDSTLKILQKHPEVLKLSAKHLKDRGDVLRRLGFKEGSLDHVAFHYPSIFILPHKRIQAVEHLLREKCLFTVQQVSKILQTCPNILLEDLDYLECKFQFAYFRMGVKQRAIVKAGYFQASLAEIKNRVIFLERLGLYQTPDKKGQTQIVNPKLKRIIRASESDFVTNIACSSIEEYEIFKQLLAREEEQRWKHEALKVELLDLESDGEESDTE